MAYARESTSQLLPELSVHDSRETIKRTLAAARDLLGLEIEYLTRVDPDEDTERSEPGSFSAPLRFSDGRVYGRVRASASSPGRSLDDRDAAFVRVLAQVVSEQLEREERDLERERERAETTALQGLIAAIDARDSYTGDHSRSVVELAVQVARQLGLDARERARVEHVALLHDVGKVAIPDDVLLKAGALDSSEYALVRRHPVVGAQIIRSVPDLAHLASAVRSSHERWDGQGYPDGVAGEDIPLSSRITFVCDAYDAMTSDRPYRRALRPPTALAELRRNAARQFCPRSVDALLHVLDATEGSPLRVAPTPA